MYKLSAISFPHVTAVLSLAVQSCRRQRTLDVLISHQSSLGGTSVAEILKRSALAEIYFNSNPRTPY